MYRRETKTTNYECVNWVCQIFHLSFQFKNSRCVCFSSILKKNQSPSEEKIFDDVSNLNALAPAVVSS